MIDSAPVLRPRGGSAPGSWAKVHDRGLAVVAPAHEGRRVADPPVLHAVDRDLGDQHRLQRDPRSVLAGAPAALAAGRAAALEALASLEGPQRLEHVASLLRLERRRMPDVVQGPVVAVQPQEQRADAVARLGQAVAADHAVECGPMLHLHPAALARAVGLVEALRDDAVLARCPRRRRTMPARPRDPRCWHRPARWVR